MSMSNPITHPFVSAVLDGVNTGFVRPSDWNEPHVVGVGGSVAAGVLPVIGYTRVTPVGNVGAGASDLMAYDVPANALAVDGDFLEILALGVLYQPCLLSCFFGTAEIFSRTMPSGMRSWRLEGALWRLGATSQMSQVKVLVASASTWVEETISVLQMTEDLSAPVTLKIVVDGTADDDLVQHLFRVIVSAAP